MIVSNGSLERTGAGQENLAKTLRYVMFLNSRIQLMVVLSEPQNANLRVTLMVNSVDHI